jgi:hypothetical protein
LKGFLPRRYAPIGVGVAWFALLQGTGFIIENTGHGHALDPLLWRGISVAIAATASLISRSHVLKLGMRLVGIRLIHSLGLTSKASYLRMRASVEQTFADDIRTRV